MKRELPSLHAARSVLILAILLVLAVSGCSADGEDTSGTSSPDAEGSEEGSADDGFGSDLMIAAVNASYASTRTLSAPPPEYYQALKECMNEQGFDYFEPPPAEAIIPADQQAALLDEIAGLDPTSSLFRNRYGYGVSTISAYLTVGFTESPNAEHLAGMTPAEQDAWYLAAYGDDAFRAQQEARSTEEQVTFEAGGCSKQADDATRDIPGTVQDAGSEWRELLQRIESMSEHVELEREWSECAAEQGYPQLTEARSATDWLYEKLDELQQPDPFAGMTEEEVRALDEAEFEELADLQGRLYDLDDLAVLQEEELELAQQLKDCDLAYWKGLAELEQQLTGES